MRFYYFITLSYTLPLKYPSPPTYFNFGFLCHTTTNIWWVWRKYPHKKIDLDTKSRRVSQNNFKTYVDRTVCCNLILWLFYALFCFRNVCNYYITKLIIWGQACPADGGTILFKNVCWIQKNHIFITYSLFCVRRHLEGAKG